MKQCQYGGYTESVIAESNPDVNQHADNRDGDGNDGVSSHFAGNRCGNCLGIDGLFIDSELTRKQFGYLEILELQAEGKKRMDAKSFLLGNKVEINTVLGD